MITSKLLLKQFGLYKLFIVLVLSLVASQSRAQSGWEVGISGGLSLPTTGYKGVLDNGWLLSAEGKYRFGEGNFAVGMKTDFVRLQEDKDPSDDFQNARMTIAPIFLTAEYEMNQKGKLRPYVVGGLGVSLFNLSYDTSPTAGEDIFNVSFSMSPQFGLRYQASEHIFPFAEAKTVLLADGPPQGFPKADQMTGYNALVAGINYRF